MRWIASSLLAIPLFAGTSEAIVVEIPLPALTGHYPVILPNNEWASAVVQLPGTPSQIHSVSLRVRGTTEVGVLRCEDIVGPWGTSAGGHFGTALPQAWMVQESNGATKGPFDWTATFEPYSSQTTWDMLLDGSERLYFQAGANGYPLICVPQTPEPTVEIEEITVIVDADFAVPAPTSSWGRIKTTYR